MELCLFFTPLVCIVSDCFHANMHASAGYGLRKQTGWTKEEHDSASQKTGDAVDVIVPQPN